MDGVLVEYRRDLNPENADRLLAEKGYFSNLRPEWNMIEAIKTLKVFFPKNVYILTSVYGKSYPYSKEEKIEYVKKVFPELLDNLIIVDIEKGESKPKKMAEILGHPINENCFLVDDYGLNLKTWKSQGGTPVKYLNLVNNSHGTIYDHTLDCFMDGEKIVNQLLEISM